DTSSEGDQLARGLFGALNAEPAGAEWYRSQVTQQDLKLATKSTSPDGHPVIDYGAKYPDGTPILKMLDANNNIVHTDLTAIITGPNAGRFPGTTGTNKPEPPCNAEGNPAMGPCVDCKFEEFFLSAWSVGDPAMLVDKPANSNNLTQNANFQPPCNTTAAFNSAPCGGTRVPASPAAPYTMQPTAKATVAFFPDDPSNVYHSYINDHVKFRILHGGTG